MHPRRSGPVMGALVVLLLVAVTGCVGGDRRGDAELGASIDAALRAHERDASADLRLADVVDGDWDRVVLLCFGVTRREARAALGADASLPPDLGTPGWLSGIALRSADGRVRLFAAGQDDELVDHWYFDPCPRDAPADGSHAVSVARDEATIAFARHRFEGDVYWQAVAVG